MNILITLAGKSRRFGKAGYIKPKFLLEIDGRPIIIHVTEMFSKEDTFYFVFNKTHISEYPEILDIIKTHVINFNITVIEPHEEGPISSALYVKDIPKKEPFILTYCDFFVEWNYNEFKNSVHEYDMVIPSFKGFHPASFGKTTYAYTQVDKNNELLNLKEKSSFTNDRTNEYANSGIYYFKNWNTFEINAQKLIKAGFGILKEGYVSLIANIIKKNGGTVLITEVKKFICLGTPEDYDMYRFWSEYFLGKEFSADADLHSDVNLIPMAGLGSRFKQESYNVLKPLIQIGNQSMFSIASNSFPKAKKWIFIFRNSIKLKNSNLLTKVNESFKDCLIKLIDETTSGQAATCLLVKDKLKKNNSLFIASCDYVSIFNNKEWVESCNDKKIDAYIWTFKTKNIIVRNHKAFAYCEIDKETNTVKKVVEKALISKDPGNDHMVIGSFWFRNTSDFIEAAEVSIRDDNSINGEHYIGNSLNYLIKKGKTIKVFEVDKWISFGDPFELEVYYYWEEFFYNRYSKRNLL